MLVNATLINLYHVCAREMWLHANGINMEQTSDIVYDGKLLHESSYPQRSDKYTDVEISAVVGGVTLTGKVDFYDPGQKIIHETKRSDKAELAHEWQAKFYLWLFMLNGIKDVTAILEYPRMRTTKDLQLTEQDVAYLQIAISNIRQILQSGKCPDQLNSKICRSCSYYDLCYIVE